MHRFYGFGHGRTFFGKVTIQPTTYLLYTVNWYHVQIYEWKEGERKEKKKDM